MNCEWAVLKAGEPCQACGRKLKKDYATTPKRECQKRPYIECAHLRLPTGNSVRVFGCGCPSERKNGFETATYECAKHTECLPRYRATSLSRECVKLCATCEDNPANK